MSAGSEIQWTDATWNPVRGCARVSAGCERCYAERHAHRFSGPRGPYEGLTVLGKHGPRWSGKARFVPVKLADPLRWRQPLRVFVNSMSDLFHEDVTDEQIAAVFGVMAACPQHTFQVLTKRPSRAAEWFRWAEVGALDRVACMADDALEALLPRADRAWAFAPGRGARVWPLPNVHLGVSVEDQATADERIPLLLECPAAVRWVSAEPLLGPVDLLYAAFNGADSLSSMAGINWVVVGGESGPGARACDVGWIRSIVGQCKAAGVPVFVKQLGSRPTRRCGRCKAGEPGCQDCRLADRKGGDPSEWPADLRVREFPEVPR